MGRKAVDSNAIFIDDLFIPKRDRIGERARAFHYILHSLNPERILIAVEAIGIGQDALRRARAATPGSACVFDRPIGQNQGIQHPLAEELDVSGGGVADGDACGLALRSVTSPAAPKPTPRSFSGARAGHDACLAGRS